MNAQPHGSSRSGCKIRHWYHVPLSLLPLDKVTGHSLWTPEWKEDQTLCRGHHCFDPDHRHCTESGSVILSLCTRKIFVFYFFMFKKDLFI